MLLSASAACADSDKLPNADQPRLYDIVDGSDTIRTVAKAVVKIVHPSGSSGTGSFISSDGLLLTNNHVLGNEMCLREGCTISLSFQHQRGNFDLPPRELFAVPQHVDGGLDMAVLQLFMDDTQAERLPTPYYLELAEQSASELVGQHVTAVGHPLGRLKKWSDGVVISADGAWFESTVFSLPGGSGSPLVNDDGELVGLLHRGANGFDLLTRTSTQVSALASAAAALRAALEQPLPSSVLSRDSVLTRSQALGHAAAFLGASLAEANVDGTRVSFVTLLGDACDDGLADESYASVDMIEASFRPCFAALDFLECRTDMKSEATAATCPDEQRDSWRARFAAVYDKQRSFNGSLDLSAVSSALEVLEDSSEAGQRVARDNILAALDEGQPPLDFSLAYYLCAYGIDTYAGQSVRDLILRYSETPFFERYAWEIAISALWLYADDLLEREQTLRIVKSLYRSDKVSVGDKLRIEEVLYSSDEL